MSYKRTAPAGLIALGFETITLANSTASGLNSTNDSATAIRFSVETNDARFRDDGSDAALTTGVLIQADTTNFWEGINGANVSFQRSTGTCEIHLMAYTRPGEPTS